MSVTLIVALILVGLLLLIIELLVVPGVSVAGIASLVFLSAGVILSYKYFGGTIGNITLLSTLLAVIITIVIALKPGTWKKISLHTAIDSKIEDNFTDSIHPGDKGVAKSKLSPIGEIVVNDLVAEAESIGPYIDAGEKIEIVKVEQKKIYVKPLT
ncbi:MAG: NfeD family protein [Bacteroidales bacterium]|nr:NfeD family protein [Bacteroidales bacterium]